MLVCTHTHTCTHLYTSLYTACAACYSFVWGRGIDAAPLMRLMVKSRVGARSASHTHTPHALCGFDSMINQSTVLMQTGSDTFRHPHTYTLAHLFTQSHTVPTDAVKHVFSCALAGAPELCINKVRDIYQLKLWHN